MSEELVNIEVNGVPMKARKGEVIIRATDREGVYIPRFCYHDKLPIAANCRMCLVEVEKAPKPLPACATPVAEGMKIFTASVKATGAQRATMEFLLINHPLDCPICDQGGECELQDLAVGFGRDVSRFVERKRVVKDKNLGPLVSSDMTRCIHCTRCVRFGQDVAGIQELGATGRGEHMEIGTYIEHSVDHELSGNIIDLCPVGALNSKPFRYRARGWEMTQAPMISPHDGVGTQLYGHVLRGRLMRVVPRPCDDINETWIADRDRYSYEGIYSDDRLLAPRVRQADGSWLEVEWEVALRAAADGLKQAGRELGVLAHPSSTLEELYLAARLAEGLGSANVDHRLRQCDFRGQGLDTHAPALGVPIADIDQLDALLVVGANLRREVPILAHRVRKAAMRGAQISFLAPARFEYLFPVAHHCVASPAGQLAQLIGVLRAALAGAPMPPEIAAIAAAHGAAAAPAGEPAVTEQQRGLAESLKRGERRAIWLGALALRSDRYAELRALARALAQATGASFGELAEGSNAAGAYLAGMLPHRGAGGAARVATGRNARLMLEQSLPAYLLLHTEPWADADVPAALQTLEAADCVVAVTAYASGQMKRVADVLLPAGTFAETSGTYVNLEGRWQSFGGAARPVGAARPAWKILRVLGNLLDLQGFDYQSSEQARDELAARVSAVATAPAPAPGPIPPPAGSRTQHAATLDVPMYQVDAIVRRAASLQRTRDGRAEPQRYGDAIVSALGQLWAQLPPYAHSGVFTIVLMIVLILSVAYLTLWERKFIGWIQMRLGPNRVRIFGLLPGMGQPFADVIKLLIKEIVIPARANKLLFALAPAVALIPAFAAWAVVPIAPHYAIANVDAGLLYILSLTSMGVYGVIIAGWASNSKYAFLGAMRSAAQMVAYEIAMGFALVGVLMVSRSLDLGTIVARQQGGVLAWNWFWLLPLLVVYFISGVAETNRAPFDVAEGESEIVAGFHVEYSGMAFALFFLAEYANMILIAGLTSVFFFGGWLSPFQGYPGVGATALALPGTWWLVLKIFVLLCFFLWFRATFPRYRYDQIMRLGWKALIPVTLVWIVVEGLMAWWHVGPWRA